MGSQLLFRAVTAFLALPGVVAFVVPWLLRPPRRPAVDGLALMALGTAGLLWCVREFSVVGRGTLAPWAPPGTLVSSGPYRWSRNPMYVGVLVTLIGWAVAYRSWALAGYAGGVATAFHLRIVLYEEPRLARLADGAWVAYRNRTPRWVGCRRAPDTHGRTRR